MTKWQSKLTKAQRKHLRWGGLNTLAALGDQKKYIAELRAKFGPTDGCPECAAIITRLESKGVRLPA